MLSTKEIAQQVESKTTCTSSISYDVDHEEFHKKENCVDVNELLQVFFV